MKLLSTFVFFSLSLSSFAAGDQFKKYPRSEALLISEAIQESLKQSPVSCTVTETGASMTTENIIGMVNYSLTSATAKGTLSVDESGPTSVVKIKYEIVSTNIEMYLETSSDLKTVTKIEGKQYDLEVKRVNTGTIVKPVFIEEELQTKVFNFKCN